MRLSKAYYTYFFTKVALEFCLSLICVASKPDSMLLLSCVHSRTEPVGACAAGQRLIMAVVALI